MTKILVIEDEEPIRNEVIGATNSYLGLETAVRENPDLMRFCDAGNGWTSCTIRQGLSILFESESTFLALQMGIGVNTH